ncbi:MAG: HAMP domain-containing histidine kinase [Gammaproteobacteria bacterium]|nr:HAMP domain-containing histidine kinase [Gammaproteobacteria bacterium]
MSASEPTLPYANKTNLNRLFRLRNALIITQIPALLFVYYGLGILIPIDTCSLIIALQALFNAYAWIRIKNSNEVSDNEIFIHLTLDVLALSAMLYFTGGATNPFIILFLFPLAITVTILPAKYAWILASITITCYSLLMWKYIPLPIDHSMHTPKHNDEYNLHIIGMWLAFIAIAGLITHYVFNMGNTLRKQQILLTQAREKSLQDEQLIMLGTLAASTAHELGTPLGTMLLLTNEIKNELKQAPELVLNDLDNLNRQIERCKLALSQLSTSTGGSPLQNGKAMKIEDYFHQLLKEILESKPQARIKTQWNNTNPDALILADRSLSQALSNIINNAIEASTEAVEWHAHWDQKQLKITISDRGPGLSEEAISTIGNTPFSEKEHGLGLGLYLAHAIIKRLNGEVSHRNRKDGGNCTEIKLPLIY